MEKIVKIEAAQLSQLENVLSNNAIVSNIASEVVAGNGVQEEASFNLSFGLSIDIF